MNQTSCFSPAHILLPAEQIPLEQWGCVACDQFTSDRSYWERAAEAAAGSPSALNLILPEVYLEESDVPARVAKIHETMEDYAHNVLTRAVDGFIYVERTERSGRAMPRGPARPSAPVSGRWRSASRPAWRCAGVPASKRPM